MLRKLIGVLMLVLLFGSLFAFTAYHCSVRGALIIFGMAFALTIFITIAICLIIG